MDLANTIVLVIPIHWKQISAMNWKIVGWSDSCQNSILSMKDQSLKRTLDGQKQVIDTWSNYFETIYFTKWMRWVCLWWIWDMLYHVSTRWVERVSQKNKERLFNQCGSLTSWMLGRMKTSCWLRETTRHPSLSLTRNWNHASLLLLTTFTQRHQTHRQQQQIKKNKVHLI